MKNKFKTIARTMSITPFLFAASLLTAALDSKAQSISKAALPDSAVSILYKGGKGNTMSLLLQFKNIQKDRYRIEVHNDHQYELHNERFEGVSYSRVFTIPEYEGALTFTVQNLKTKSKTIFKTTKMVYSYTDMAIERVK